MMDRRTAMLSIGAAGVGVMVGAGAAPGAPTAFGGAPFATTIARLETASGGRLGLAVLDLQTGQRFSHRGGERFPMCSTFKFLLTANILALADHDGAVLRRMVPVRRSDLVPNSPVTARHAGGALSVAGLCAATMIESDNAAADLLLPLVGGPAGLTRFVRMLGDPVTRQDGMEAQATAVPADPRDTTTPDAMAATMRTLLFAGPLSQPARAQLTAWLRASRTGGTRLRAGLPASWRVGDKTGTGQHGSSNDIAVATPPGRRPLVIACYLNGSTGTDAALHAIHAGVGRAITRAITGAGTGA